MPAHTLSAAPTYRIETAGEEWRVALAGRWTLGEASVEASARKLSRDMSKATSVAIDIAGVEALDTAGAWLIDRCRSEVERRGGAARIQHPRTEHAILIKEAHWRDFGGRTRARGVGLINILADIGHTLAISMKDVSSGLAYFGEVLAALFRLMLHPRRFRFVSLIYHIENFALRSLPIIALINFLVGGIVGQQGIFQLQQFGASTFAVDLIGILVLRELAVLLTSIMVAGR